MEQALKSKEIPPDKKLIWIHVASLGEFEQGHPLMKALRQAYADKVFILLTFFSPSGYEVRKDYELADVVTYLPLDVPKYVRQFLDLFTPDLAIFIKNDLWFNFLSECLRRGVTCVSAVSMFRPDQIYFNRGKRLFLPILRKMDHFFVQDGRSFEVLAKKNIAQATVAGDTRVDRVVTIASETFGNESIQRFIDGNRLLIVFGSVWSSDMGIVEAVMKALPQYQYILAPHNVDDGKLKSRLDALKGRTFYSSSKLNGRDVLILDVIGLLSRVYRFARYAYVGGAFQSGVHNTLEPAAYGIPIFVGDTRLIRKFSEIEELSASGGIILTDQHGNEMLRMISELDQNPSEYDERAAIVKNYISQHRGATDIISNYLINQLK